MCEPRIYVADLAAYNAGILHGIWIDACDDLDSIQEQINQMLEQTPIDEVAEEYALHDYEGFAGYSLSEYEGIKRVHELACFIDEHGQIAGDLLNHWDGDIEEAQKAIEEDYCGQYASLADYAQTLTEETTQIPAHLQYYIDYERMGRDMEMSSDIYSIETAHDGLHVFYNH